MAYDKITLVFSIEDAKSQAVTKTFELSTVDATQAEIDAAALEVLYQAMCDGEILAYNVIGTKNVSDSPAASSLKTDVMSVTMQLDGRPDKGNMRLPCFPDSLSDSDGKLLLADASVVAFQNAFISATPAIAKVSDGEFITTFVRGRLKK